MNLKDLMDKIDENDSHTNKFIEKLIRKVEIQNSQIERFRNLSVEEQNTYIDKCITKYNSQAYKDKEYAKGYMPRKELFWDLYYYAQKYGRECTKEERNIYFSDFTDALYVLNEKYVIQVYQGQGAEIEIFKK